MKATKLGKRFFDSTRGRIVTLLRGTSRNVNWLAEELRLTDNAVRSHLLTLERDGLVRQRGVQRGHRKPHFTYELTPEAEQLFPKAYDALLNQLITVLKGRLAPKVVERVLREVGRSLAKNQASDLGSKDLEGRARRVLKVLETLGGSAKIEREKSKLLIQSQSCPFAAVVAEHPEVCHLAEALVAKVMGVPVRERCAREEFPQCRFEIADRAREERA
ncbi:MAG TPA: ArsR family transcriptional regulator [Pyrinomonadaceae bacterium]|nr:ArsR family transcriptional regulator [Pyrinomonadaceae bacterium]